MTAIRSAAETIRIIRSAIEAHTPEYRFCGQWYVDGLVIDADADEFWAVAEQALKTVKGEP